MTDSQPHQEGRKMSASKEHSGLVTKEPLDKPGNSARGRRIQRRRMSHGLSVRELHEQSGVSREAIKAAEDGAASELTYTRIENWLDRFDEETGSDREDVSSEEASNMIRFRVEGVYGAKALVVEGPFDRIEELEAAVDRIMRRIQGTQDGPADSD